MVFWENQSGRFSMLSMMTAPSSSAHLRTPFFQTELGAVLLRFRGAAWSILLLSVILNLLALTGSIYLLLIYDRILPSSSIQSLVSLFVIVIVLYLFQGAFEAMRANLLQMVGEGLDRRLAGRLQQLESYWAAQRSLTAMPSPTMRDLDQIRGFFFSQGPAALIDLPWIAFFLTILWLLHPLLGITTLVGTLALAVVTWLNDRQSRAGVEETNRLAGHRQVVSERVRRNINTITGLAMQSRMNQLATSAHSRFVQAQTSLSRVLSKYTALGRGLRMFVQAAVLTAGAVLVIRGEASAGIIFASSILAGRALAPVDQAIANWRVFVGARQAWRRLVPMMEQHPPRTAPSVLLDVPRERFQVEQLSVMPPGAEAAVVDAVDFMLRAGDAVAVVGSSGSGKSSLARAIVNVWPTASGAIRLDGAPLDHYHEDRLRAAIGYLPQEVELFAGTIAQNIARFDPAPPSEQVIAAAKAAGIHDLVLRLSSGYDTRVGDAGLALSAGQRQRVALARALYDDPFLLVLDEPDSNLDPAGEAALAAAIAGVRRRGGIVVVVTHRKALLNHVNWMLVMHEGKQQAFGRRDKVLAVINSKAKAATAGRARDASRQEPSGRPT